MQTTGQFTVTRIDNAISMEAWIKTTAVGPDRLLFRWWAYGYSFMLLNGVIAFGQSGGGVGVTGTKTVNDDKWHHVAAVRTNGTPSMIAVYVDGVLDKEVQSYPGPWNTYYDGGYGTQVAIGMDGHQCNNVRPSYAGKMAGFAMFNKALTPAQIASHYRWGVGDAKSFSLSVDPASSSPLVGDSVTLTAELLDFTTAAPVLGKRIGFIVSAGPNSPNGGLCAPACRTNADGKTVWSFQGSRAGEDTVTVYLDLNESGGIDSGEPQTTALVRWQLGCGTQSRVQCYAPEVRLHSQEQIRPMDASDWLLGTELKWAADGWCKNPTLSSGVTAVNIANGTFQHAAVERSGFANRRCTDRVKDTVYQTTDFTRPFSGDAFNGEKRATQRNGNPLSGDEGFYLNWVGKASTGNTPVNGEVVAPVYVEERPDVIAYWFFFPVDPKGVFPHEGDWENIQVHFDSSGNPTFVTYEAHTCGVNTPGSSLFTADDDREIQWGQVSRSGASHPIVYSSLDTHSSWPRPTVQQDVTRRVCGQVGVGTTDQTDYIPGQSVIWKTWKNPVRVQDQCWYGYGGAWGDTGLGVNAGGAGPIPQVNVKSALTGPIGPPFNGRNGPRLAKQVNCKNPAGKVKVNGPVGGGSGGSWRLSIPITGTDGVPGTPYAVALESIPTVLASGTVDANGNIDTTITIPEGTAPGIHYIVLRNPLTGEDQSLTSINVDAPSECVSTSDPITDDVDGDFLKDACDPTPTDGPLADYDGDGIANQTDNCQTVANPNQAANFERSDGAACDRREGYNITSTYRQPTVIRSRGCGVCVLGPTAVTLNGTSSIASKYRSIGIAGNTRLVGNSSLTASGFGAEVRVQGTSQLVGQSTVTPSPIQGAPVDPLASLPAPTPIVSAANGSTSVTGSNPTEIRGGTWGAVSVVGNANVTLNPGTFGSLSATGAATLTLKPGVYTFTGPLSITGNTKLVGSDVTLYFACGTEVTPRICNPGEAGGRLTINGTGTFSELSGKADTTVLVFVDRQNTAPMTLNGTLINSRANGTIYARATPLTINGASLKQPLNSSLIVGSLTLNGNSKIETTHATI